MIRNIQALRAVAAIAVVIHHIFWIMGERLAPGAWPSDFRIGSTGVDIFFVISGFVMAFSVSASHPSAYDFIKNRIVRIVPLYWVATAIVAIVSVAGLKVIGCPEISLQKILSSLAFLPMADASGAVSDPVLFVGWSLNYEMMFYLGFALSLLLPRRMSLPAMLAAIVGCWLWQLSSTSVAAHYLGSDIILAFAAGIALHFIPRSMATPKSAILLGLLAGTVFLATIDMPWLRSSQHAHLAVILGASLIVGSAIVAENAGLAIGQGLTTRLGDASYALYLFHPLVLQILMKIWLIVHLQKSIAGLCAFVPIAVIASCVAADIIHRSIEQPMLRALKRKRPVPPPQETEIAPMARAGGLA
jgi:exopolysaccharide production protein ExoZ